MKIGTCLHQNAPHLFVADGADAVLPALVGQYELPDNVLDLIAAGPGIWARLMDFRAKAPAEARIPLEGVSLLAPIPRPTKNIMCLGWNYSEHVRESADASGREAKLPEDPVVFTKNATSVTGPGAVVPYDAQVTRELDWEVELGVVIGRGGKGISKERALEHVFGYTVINDLSARDLQFRHKQFFIGKSLDGACPMGPWIATADEISDPQDLGLRCRVNGKVKQDSNTRFMIFDVPTIIATLSKGMTLEPGDIIATGTPSGVGFARQPPEFLQPGDIVECEIDRIGAIGNRIRG